MDRDARTIERVTRVGDLYDWYGALLTERQRQWVELYFFDDWSLAEIAEHFGVTRQAVHDNLRRAEDQLEAYERALALHAQARQQQHAWQRLQAVWQRVQGYLPVAERGELAARLEELAAVCRFAGERGE
ncbi:MAG: YlxM family DNA-binding protein [Alicyclobacillus sp.]|nr:YlxM family DNA-binding protein [Alicyclobacillus sp.]